MNWYGTYCQFLLYAIYVQRNCFIYVKLTSDYCCGNPWCQEAYNKYQRYHYNTGVHETSQVWQKACFWSNLLWENCTKQCSKTTQLLRPTNYWKSNFMTITCLLFHQNNIQFIRLKHLIQISNNNFLK